MDAKPARGDFVDRVRHGWARNWPDLDVATVEVMGRITRIAALTNQRVERDLAPVAVTRAEFDVLCTLARADSPLRASDVTAATMLSGASTTKNAERLVQRCLVERLPWELDGRVVLLQLTEQGRDLVNREFPHFLERDSQVLEGLSAKEQVQLASLLRKVALRAETVD
ncbi:MarR family transcriptional regulator [Arthrobacter sp. LAPM80]|uniref:MarR family winged helix-turn-helix transcriptional regulator n=1 Tax=Arthrobacter sp. LAPM80 TaxID=3141788 RepID=UPI00398B9075